MFAILGKLYIKKNKPIIIWITWSVWKTSSRTIIYQVFSKLLKDKRVYSSPKNYNSELWIVFSIFKFEKFNYKLNSLFLVYFLFLKELIFSKKEYEVLVLEYWIDFPWDMDFLLKIVKPDYSVLTKLDLIHMANFSSKEELIKEKMKLIENTKKLAYLNYEETKIRDIVKNLKVNYKFYNRRSLSNSEYFLEDGKIFSRVKMGNNVLETNLLWSDNFAYLELAIMLLENFWVGNIENNFCFDIENQGGRFNLFHWIKDSILVDSTYNAGPESMLKMLENIQNLRNQIFKNYKLLFVIWDMRELWESSNFEHKKIFKYFNAIWDIISVWINTKENFQEHLWNFKYSRDAWLFLKNYLDNSEEKFLILFKWSQNTIFMEEALKQVLKNEEDRNKLIRQEKYWLEIKKEYI